MKIECPDCEQTLRSAFYEGVPVHVCFGCKGFFLDDEDKLIQIEEIREISVDKDALSASHRGGDLSRICPICKEFMKKVDFGKITITIIDKCERCGGIWLDRGEIDRIQADFELCEDNREQNIRDHKP